MYAKWLFKAIVSLGRHPLMRINAIGNFAPRNGSAGRLSEFVPASGEFYSAEGTAFRHGSRLKCTLLTYGDADRQPLLLLTDLPPEGADPLWYGMRFWIERRFKILKSAAMQLERSRMRAPDRFERMLLPAAVALIYEIGAACSYEDEAEPDYNLPKSQRQRASGTAGRRHCLATLGAALLRPMLAAGRKLATIKLTPEPSLKHGFFSSA